jgi:DNA-binding YbaB/EbfC family protein
MFDALKNIASFPQILAKAGEMRTRMMALQEELGRREVSAEAGAGMVTAFVNGRMELLRVRIDPGKTDVGDVEMLEDLIVAAVNAAQEKARNVMQEEMGRLASELGLPAGMMPSP